MPTKTFLVPHVVGLGMLLLSLGMSGCYAGDVSDEGFSESGGQSELGVGQIAGEQNLRNPAAWSHALRCKDIPAVEALRSPEIVVSIDGLTLHLRDRAGTYDRVFAIGVGVVGSDGESITPTSEVAPTGHFYTGSDTREVPDAAWGYYYPCRIWHQDGGTRTPVFAGLPFIRLAGPPGSGYGIHGPIDNFVAPNGGSLRRGYVSHGCVRMSAEDIVEVYGRIRGRAHTPVRIQREVERDANGRAVDLATRWVGAECASNADCNFDGGVCRIVDGAARGMCTVPCTRTCADRPGETTTMCAADGPMNGYCVPAASTTFNNNCARYEGRLSLQRTQRPGIASSALACR